MSNDTQDREANMAQTTPTPPIVEVMWRPGCPFCSSLRRGLSRAGVATVEHDIWSSADAAARVRGATGGDETVPTVFVGDWTLVNPSVREVLDAISDVDPPTGPAGNKLTGIRPTRQPDLETQPCCQTPSKRSSRPRSPRTELISATSARSS